MATIRLRMAESKAEITKPPAFLIIFASPFFKPRAAGSNSVSLVTYSLSFCCNVQPLSPWYIICLVMPPSMQMFSPVMKPALSEQRNGTPQRCIVQCLVHHLLWRLIYPWNPYLFQFVKLEFNVLLRCVTSGEVNEGWPLSADRDLPLLLSAR